MINRCSPLVSSILFLFYAMPCHAMRRGCIHWRHALGEIAWIPEANIVDPWILRMHTYMHTYVHTKNAGSDTGIDHELSIIAIITRTQVQT